MRRSSVTLLVLTLVASYAGELKAENLTASVRSSVPLDDEIPHDVADDGYTARECRDEATRTGQWPEACGTPRLGVWSGGYLSLGFGQTFYRPRTRTRVGIGRGRGFEVGGGLVFLDRLVIDIHIGVTFAQDKRPLSETVVDCTEFDGHVIDCSGPRTEHSTVDGFMVAYEAGYQYRFRPSRRVSLAPALLVGFVHYPGGMSRGVGCKGCDPAVRLDIDAYGAALTPVLKLTFGSHGAFGLVARTRLVLGGDITFQWTFGFAGPVP